MSYKPIPVVVSKEARRSTGQAQKNRLNLDVEYQAQLKTQVLLLPAQEQGVFNNRAVYIQNSQLSIREKYGWFL